MRDKNRIRSFCEELASLWEQKPELRFGQIISSLPKYSEKSGNLFYLEEDEMSEVIRRYFSEKPKKAVDDKLFDLEMQWKELTEELQAYNKFDAESFKKLFYDTWQYFTDTAGAAVGIDYRKIPVICSISVFCGHTDYPDNTDEWDFEACLRIAEAFLGALSDPLHGGYKGNFYDGYITVNEFHKATHELHISELDEYFNELSEMYRKNAEEYE